MSQRRDARFWRPERNRHVFPVYRIRLLRRCARGISRKIRITLGPSGFMRNATALLMLVEIRRFLTPGPRANIRRCVMRAQYLPHPTAGEIGPIALGITMS